MSAPSLFDLKNAPLERRSTHSCPLERGNEEYFLMAGGYTKNQKTGKPRQI